MNQLLTEVQGRLEFQLFQGKLSLRDLTVFLISNSKRRKLCFDFFAKIFTAILKSNNIVGDTLWKMTNPFNSGDSYGGNQAPVIIPPQGNPNAPSAGAVSLWSNFSRTSRLWWLFNVSDELPVLTRRAGSASSVRHGSVVPAIDTNWNWIWVSHSTMSLWCRPDDWILFLKCGDLGSNSTRIPQTVSQIRQRAEDPCSLPLRILRGKALVPANLRRKDHATAEQSISRSAASQKEGRILRKLHSWRRPLPRAILIIHRCLHWRELKSKAAKFARLGRGSSGQFRTWRHVPSFAGLTRQKFQWQLAVGAAEVVSDVRRVAQEEPRGARSANAATVHQVRLDRFID